MFARILNCEVKLEKKEEFVKIVKNEILPILKKQTGFLEVLPFFPEKMNEEKVITISLGPRRRMPSAMRGSFIPKFSTGRDFRTTSHWGAAAGMLTPKG